MAGILLGLTGGTVWGGGQGDMLAADWRSIGVCEKGRGDFYSGLSRQEAGS